MLFRSKPDKSTKAKFEKYEKPDWAKGYDVIIHDECSADVKDLDYVRNILAAHKAGVAAVNLHCAMHSYRVGEFRAPVQPGSLLAALEGWQAAAAPVDLPVQDVFPVGSFAPTDALPGIVAFVSQSGALVTAVLDWARARDIGFSYFISLGDASDVDVGDVLAKYWLERGTPLLYSVSFGTIGASDGRDLFVYISKNGSSKVGVSIFHTEPLPNGLNASIALRVTFIKACSGFTCPIIIMANCSPK